MALLRHTQLLRNPFQKEEAWASDLVWSSLELLGNTRNKIYNSFRVEGKVLGFFSAIGRLDVSSPLNPVDKEGFLVNLGTRNNYIRPF